MKIVLTFTGLATIAAFPRPYREIAAGFVLLALAVWGGYAWGVSDRPVSEVLLNAAYRAREEAMNGG